MYNLTMDAKDLKTYCRQMICGNLCVKGGGEHACPNLYPG